MEHWEEYLESSVAISYVAQSISVLLLAKSTLHFD